MNHNKWAPGSLAESGACFFRSVMYVRILLQRPLAANQEERLKRAGAQLIHAASLEKTAVIEQLQDCQAMTVSANPSGYVFDEAFFSAAPSLQMISRFGIGMECFDLAAAKRHNVTIANTAGSNANAVAEHAVLLMLACLRNLREVDRRFRGGEFFEIRNQLGAELKDKTVAVIGYGHIGRLVARKLVYGFGCGVIVFDPYAHAPMDERVTFACSLQEALEKSDIVSLHLPLSADTAHLLDERTFAMMRKGTVLVNTARGGLIREAALVTALKNDTLAAAGLDVFETEPPEMKNELFALPNVIMTPHCAAFTRESMAVTAQYGVDNLLEWMAGEKPKRSVV